MGNVVIIIILTGNDIVRLIAQPSTTTGRKNKPEIPLMGEGGRFTCILCA